MCIDMDFAENRIKYNYVKIEISGFGLWTYRKCLHTNYVEILI